MFLMNEESGWSRKWDMKLIRKKKEWRNYFSYADPKIDWKHEIWSKWKDWETKLKLIQRFGFFWNVSNKIILLMIIGFCEIRMKTKQKKIQMKMKAFLIISEICVWIIKFILPIIPWNNLPKFQLKQNEFSWA